MTSISYSKSLLPAILLCTAVALTACQEAEPQANTNQDAAATHEALARQYVEAYNARDVAALEDILGDPLTMNGQEYARGDFLGATQGYWEAFPDIELDPTHIVGAEDHVTVRMMFSGTGAGEYLGHNVDGREIEASETVLFHVTDGQLDEYWSDWDALGFWVQLGVLESPYPEQ